MPAVILINTNRKAGTHTSLDEIGRVLRELRPGLDTRLFHFLELDEAALRTIAPDAVVVGPQGAPWWKYPAGHVRHMDALVRAMEAPLLGVCGGHQAFVRAHGGIIEPVRRIAEGNTYSAFENFKGWYCVDQHLDDPLFDGVAFPAQVSESHHEHVAALPDSFALIATARHARVQAVRLRGRAAWGVQFHPERHDAGHPAGRTVLANFVRLALS